MNQKILRILSGVSLIFFMVLVCFIYWDKTRTQGVDFLLFNIKKIVRAETVPKELYPSVDHATYLALQKVMDTKYNKPMVIEDSLKYFDIDNDGDNDVVGFLRFNESGQSYRLFRTWYNTPSGFEYYENYSDGFRLHDMYDEDMSCSVDSVIIRQVTLYCLRQGQEYVTTLDYQKNDIGYHRDIDSNAVIYKERQDWKQYVSKRGGIDFAYPSDVTITEKTYDDYGVIKTIIVGKRGDTVLFEIESVPSKEDQSGGTLDPSEQMIFLKLSDGSYLARGWMVKDFTNKFVMKPKGAFYQEVYSQKNTYDDNTVEVYNRVNFHNGRRYTLFSPLTEEKKMKEIDTIFSSIHYRQSDEIAQDAITSSKTNTILFANLLTLHIPGDVVTPLSRRKYPSVLEQESFEIKSINALMYSSTTLELRLLPFDSYDHRGHESDGGYDAVSNGCYSSDRDGTTPLKTIGTYSVCEHGSGADDVSHHGYLIIDPEHRYIIDISETSYAMRTGSFFGYYQSSSLGLEDLIKNIQFVP